MPGIRRRRFMPFAILIAQQVQSGPLGSVKYGEFFLRPTFLLFRANVRSLAVFPYEGEAQTFSFLYYYFFQVLEPAATTPSCPPLAPDFLTSLPRHLFGNFLSQWGINLEAFFLLDQWEYCGCGWKDLSTTIITLHLYNKAFSLSWHTAQVNVALLDVETMNSV